MATKPAFLITRPQPQAEILATKLTALGFTTICQPMFDYQPRQNAEDLAKLLANTSNPILIFVSKAAVTFANKLIPISSWQTNSIIAVGDATKHALNDLGVHAFSPQQHDSEGLLALPELEQVSGKDCIIIRGDGGRELIAEQLSARGANVHYFESYQRHWLTLPANIAEHWQAKQINTIIITSNALLKSVVQLIKDGDKFWQNTCLWLVASQRIAESAKQLGLKNVVCTYGASDQAILNALNKLELIDDK
ncbi:uroporphyrinogen-III synthase [Colwellia sp. MEBiC06753]